MKNFIKIAVVIAVLGAGMIKADAAEDTIETLKRTHACSKCDLSINTVNSF